MTDTSQPPQPHALSGVLPTAFESILRFAALALNAREAAVQLSAADHVWQAAWPSHKPDLFGRLEGTPETACWLPGKGAVAVAPLRLGPVSGWLALGFDGAPQRPDETLGRLAEVAGLVAGELEGRAHAAADGEAHQHLRSLLNAAPLAIYALTLEGLVKHWNSAAEQTLGWRAEEVLGQPLPDPALNHTFSALRHSLAGGEGRGERALRHRRQDGREVDVTLTATSLRDEAGALTGMVGVARELDAGAAEGRQAQQQLRLLESVLAHANDSVLITEAEPVDQPGPRILYANEAFTRTTGYTLGDVLGKTPRILHGPRTDRAASDKIRAALKSWQPVEVEVLNYRKDGTEFWVELSIAPVADETGWYTHWISIQRDISERKQSAARMERERNHVLELAARGAPLSEVLALLAAMLGQQPGQHAAIRVRDERQDDLLVGLEGWSAGSVGDLTRALSALSLDAGAARLVLPASGRLPGVQTWWAQPVMSGEGRSLGALLLGVPHDEDLGDDVRANLEAAAGLAALVIERYGAQAALERQALFDSLTALPNRALFERRLAAELDGARCGGQRVAVGLMDLDRFKLVNDTLGHSAGDALLRQVAARLGGVTRPQDTLARMGGDEFLLVLPNVGDGEVRAVAERVLHALGQPFEVAGHSVFVRPSIGFSVFPEFAATSEELLQQADSAMYRAKRLGGGYRQYAPDDRAAPASMSLESDLNYALERGELVLHYQAQMDARAGDLVGLEALLRWQHPHRGLIPPGDFIPLAEATGLIVPIGAWVLGEAARQAVAWSARWPALRMAVNLSARQFLQPDLTSVVARALQESGLSPARLELELTESMLTQAAEAAATLAQLKGLGVRVAVDDFGTGYSNLAYLKRFPIDALKIDRSFTADLPGTCELTRDAALVKAIIDLAHALKLDVIAEGVEHGHQLRFLREHGCDLAQGFFFGRPMSAAQLEGTAFQDGQLSV